MDTPINVTKPENGYAIIPTDMQLSLINILFFKVKLLQNEISTVL
jgi:hypothetical protein